MTASIVLYGIPNCDTVKKSRAWLDTHNLVYEFHDFKKQGVPAAALARWVQVLGWEALLNKQGTTWRKLAPTQQAEVINAETAMRCMMANSSVTKRPVVELGSAITVGFLPSVWEAHL